MVVMQTFWLLFEIRTITRTRLTPWGVLRSSQCEEYFSSAMEVSMEVFYYYQNTFQVMSTCPNQIKKKDF